MPKKRALPVLLIVVAVSLLMVGPVLAQDVEVAWGAVLIEDFVPEPGAIFLLASGLMGLAGYAGLRLRKH